MRRKSIYKAAGIAVALLLVYAALGYGLVPHLVQRSLPQYAQENLGTQATVGTVRFNPFLMKLEASDFQLLSQPDKPLAGFTRLLVDLELVSSLFNWAWTLKDVQVDGLQVNAEIQPDGELNLAQLADYWAKRNPPQPDSKPVRAILQHLQLTGATFTFTDLSSPQRATIRSDAINFDVSDLATIPDREGRYALSGRFADGGAISWRGELSLQPIASHGEWQIENLKLASLWQFFRDELKISEPGGALSLSGRYRFSYDNGVPALSLEALRARLAKLSLTRSGEQRPMAELATFEVVDARYDLARNDLLIPQLTIADGTLSARLSRDGKVDWQELTVGEPRPRTDSQGGAAKPFHARIDNVAIDKIGLRYSDQTRGKGLDFAVDSLSAALKVDVASGSGSERVALEDVRLGVSNVRIQAADSASPLVALKSVVLDGAQVDTNARSVVIATVSAKGGSIAFARMGGGVIAFVDAFTAAQSARKPAAGSKRAEQDWKYAVHAADFSDIDVAVTDHNYKPAVHYDLLASGALKNIASDGKQPVDFSAKLRSTQGGTIQASGTVTQDFSQASAKLDISGLVTVPLRPVLSQYTVLDLKSGTASASVRLEYRNGGKPVVRVQGNATVADLLVNEAATENRFVSWKTLEAVDVALTLTPNRLNIKEVRVDQPGAKIAITKDGSVNLAQVLKKPAATPAETAKSAAEAEADPFPVRVGRVSLRRGIVDFSDDSLVLPFATRVRSLDGAIVGLSSYPKSRAELKLEGTIEPNGTAHASGSLRPLDPTSLLDITVRFDNVEMPPLSPYTATFAGRKIAAGKLWVEVQYKIADRQLLGENKIAMSDFQLGERVDSPSALDLPLDLAVALLKGTDGRIALAVPVRGDLNNPKFDYGTLIRDAIGNVLRRIVTAPFRFIAGLFGGGGDEDLQSVTFEPGSARLTPPEREQLEKVAQALKGRQQLKLVVHGAYDPQRDARALRDTLVRRELVQALGTKLGEREDAGPVAFDDPDTQRALEKMMTGRAGADAVDRFAADYAKKSGKEVQRVNPVLAVFRRGRGDRAFYEAVFERLVETQPLADTVLADLATRRARSIADFVAKTGIDADRVVVGTSETVPDGAKGPAAKLTLEAA